MALFQIESRNLGVVASAAPYVGVLFYRCSDLRNMKGVGINEWEAFSIISQGFQKYLNLIENGLINFCKSTLLSIRYLVYLAKFANWAMWTVLFSIRVIIFQITMKKKSPQR